MYVTPPGFAPVWRMWGGEHALFDCYSGSTYLFDDVTASVLKTLQSEPVPLPALIERVAESLLFVVDDDLHQHIQTVLSELAYKKLIITTAE